MQYCWSKAVVSNNWTSCRLKEIFGKSKDIIFFLNIRKLKLVLNRTDYTFHSDSNKWSTKKRNCTLQYPIASKHDIL